MARPYRNVKVILIIDGEPLPLHWSLYERIAAMVLGLEREDSAKKLDLSTPQLQGLRSIGTQKHERVKVLQQAYGETVAIAQDRELSPRLLLLLLAG